MDSADPDPILLDCVMQFSGFAVVANGDPLGHYAEFGGSIRCDDGSADGLAVEVSPDGRRSLVVRVPLDDAVL